MLEREEVRKVLSQFARDVVVQSRTNLLGKNTTSTLTNSIESRLDVGANSFDLDFLMEDYGKYQDKGVKGAKSSAKAPNSPYQYGTGTAPKKQFKLAINGWIIQKGLAPRDKSGRFISRKSLAFLIRRSIYNTGLRPTLFFTKPFEKEFKELPEELKYAYALDVENLMEATLNNK